MGRGAAAGTRVDAMEEGDKKGPSCHRGGSPYPLIPVHAVASPDSIPCCSCPIVAGGCREHAGAEPIEMLSNKAAASGRSGEEIRIARLWLRPAAASGSSGEGIGRLWLRPAIPIVPGRPWQETEESGSGSPAAQGSPDGDPLPRSRQIPLPVQVASPGPGAASSPTTSAARSSPQTLAGFFLNDGDEMYCGDSDDDSSERVVGRFISTLSRFVPLSVSFLGKQPGLKEFGLLRSCKGLLFGHKRAGDTYDSLGYIVCNPATKQWVAVPSSGFKPLPLLDEGEDTGSDSNNEIGCAFIYLIFYPAVSSHFQLVEFISDDYVCMEEVRAYSSETGGMV
ncbi:hypothetical protein C2845_PM07G06740 [Panicum miliaceum]|uniref:F-box/kelch-repeat protein n=1 Tax=Panicum miliaceum TaxID=4540 RepID=A0A3L6SLQ7_PANMI|nr:hypothetical protein C2845_PM07G06740 [Panicum miliaceum]